MENRPSLEVIKSHNTGVVRRLFGEDFLKNSVQDNLTLAEVVDANHSLAEYVYGEDVAKLVYDRNLELLDSVHHDRTEAIIGDERLLDDVYLDRMALVVVRPELFDQTRRCVALLESRGLRVVYQKQIEVSFDQYWGMYHHGLKHPLSIQDFPTRTINYVDLPSEILIAVDDADLVRNRLPLSDYLNKNIKGEHGTYKEGTLRGDIAYSHLDPLTTDYGRNIHQDYRITLDPISAIRAVVSNRWPSDDAHKQSDNPVLFYAGQGVHIPNSSELSRDLRLLLSPGEINALISADALPIKLSSLPISSY